MNCCTLVAYLFGYTEITLNVYIVIILRHTHIISIPGTTMLHSYNLLLFQLAKSSHTGLLPTLYCCLHKVLSLATLTIEMSRQ